MINRLLKNWQLIVIIILLLIIVFKSCDNNTQKFTNSEPIKAKIKTLTKKSDSTKVEVKKTDSVRTKYIVKWRTKLHDTTIYRACEEVIIICDSIILVDSTEIGQLKQVITLSDSIIVNQKVMLYNDSLDLLAAKKYGKQQRIQKNLALLGLGVLGGMLLVK